MLIDGAETGMKSCLDSDGEDSDEVCAVGCVSHHSLIRDRRRRMSRAVKMTTMRVGTRAMAVSPAVAANTRGARTSPSGCTPPLIRHTSHKGVVLTGNA